jgi:hypothetical protein
LNLSCWFETRSWEDRVVASAGGPIRASLAGASEYNPFARSTPYFIGVGSPSLQSPEGTRSGLLTGFWFGEGSTSSR